MPRKGKYKDWTPEQRAHFREYMRIYMKKRRAAQKAAKALEGEHIGDKEVQDQLR